jgi:hypothetical protein
MVLIKFVEFCVIDGYISNDFVFCKTKPDDKMNKYYAVPIKIISSRLNTAQMVKNTEMKGGIDKTAVKLDKYIKALLQIVSKTFLVEPQVEVSSIREQTFCHCNVTSGWND